MRDKELVKSLQNGNHSVFEHLYDYYSTVESYIIQNSGSKDDAKDIFQNGLLIFYRKVTAPDFVLTSTVKTFIFGICKNLWLDQLRSKKKSQYVKLIESSTESLAFKREDTGLEKYVITKLKSLGEPCISILKMHTYQLHTMKYIAEKLGYANEHTARQQKYKCLQRLRKAIPFQEIQQYL